MGRRIPFVSSWGFWRVLVPAGNAPSTHEHHIRTGFVQLCVHAQPHASTCPSMQHAFDHLITPAPPPNHQQQQLHNSVPTTRASPFQHLWMSATVGLHGKYCKPPAPAVLQFQSRSFYSFADLVAGLASRIRLHVGNAAICWLTLYVVETGKTELFK